MLLQLMMFMWNAGPVPCRRCCTQNRLDFFLDPDTDQYGNILEMAEGFWYIEDRPPDRYAGPRIFSE